MFLEYTVSRPRLELIERLPHGEYVLFRLAMRSAKRMKFDHDLAYDGLGRCPSLVAYSIQLIALDLSG
jgi:hypothetical protein